MDALAYNRIRKYPRDLIMRIQALLDAAPTGFWDAATVDAVIEFQLENHLEPDGKVGPRTVMAIQALDRNDNRDEDASDDDDDDGQFGTNPTTVDALEILASWCAAHQFDVVDYRDLVEWPRNKVYPKEYGYPRNKVRAQPKNVRTFRKWTDITTFMLHTTGVAGMSSKRGLGLPCHFYLPKQDAIVLCHDMERRLAHGHAANRFTVGLEISGVSDWDGPSQIDRAKALLCYFQSVRHGRVGDDAKCYVMAHRQSHSSRVRDPGKQIWQDVGEWAIEELGFELGPVVGSGRGVDEWRPGQA